MALQHFLLSGGVGMARVQVPGNSNLTITQERSSRIIHGSGGQITGTEERVVTSWASPTTYPPAVAVRGPMFSHRPVWNNCPPPPHPPVVLLYDENSTVKSEGQRVEGLQSMEHTVNLRGQYCRNANVCDFDSIRDTGGTLVTVGGEVQIPGEHQARKFEQVLILMPIAEGSYYVQNDLFRIIPA